MDKKPVDRVKHIIGYYNVPMSRLERELDISVNVLKSAIHRRATLRDDILNKIFDRFPEVNPLWVLRGEGTMLLDDSEELSDKGLEVKVTSGKVRKQINSYGDSNQLLAHILKEKERYIRLLEAQLKRYERLEAQLKWYERPEDSAE